MNLKTKQKGFTLVELLIVIVVIAILAAISIVAYNGIQNRAKTTSAAASAATVIKKAEAANAVKSSYPSATSGTGSFAEQSDSDLKGSGIQLVSTLTASSNNTNQVMYQKCGTAASGSTTEQARVGYWDYTKGAIVYQYLATSGDAASGVASTCTTWGTPLVGGPF